MRTPGVSFGHEDHALAPVTLGVGIRDAHDDQQLAARGHRAGRPPLAAVDDVVVAVALDPRGDVRGVRGRHLGLGHGERRAHPALEHRAQPPLLLLGRPEQGQELHVAGVRRRAVDRLGRDPRVAARDLRQRRVLQVRQAGAVLVGAREEEVPESPPTRLGLELLHDRRRRPRVGGGMGLLPEARLRGVHAVVHEGEELPLQRLGRLVEREIHRLRVPSENWRSSGASRPDRASRGRPARLPSRPRTGARRCRSCSRAR